MIGSRLELDFISWWTLRSPVPNQHVARLVPNFWEDCLRQHKYMALRNPNARRKQSPWVFLQCKRDKTHLISEGLQTHFTQPQGHLMTGSSQTSEGDISQTPQCRRPNVHNAHHALLASVSQTEMLPVRWLYTSSLIQVKTPLQCRIDLICTNTQNTARLNFFFILEVYDRYR